MKQTVDFYMFEEAFRKLRPDNFSYGGLKALFEYFEEQEADFGIEYELDVIAICCEYTEYGSILEAGEAYYFSTADEDDCLEVLTDRTVVIRFDGGIIIQDF